MRFFLDAFEEHVSDSSELSLADVASASKDFEAFADAWDPEAEEVFSAAVLCVFWPTCFGGVRPESLLLTEVGA